MGLWRRSSPRLEVDSISSQSLGTYGFDEKDRVIMLEKRGNFSRILIKLDFHIMDKVVMWYTKAFASTKGLDTLQDPNQSFPRLAHGSSLKSTLWKEKQNTLHPPHFFFIIIV